MARNHYHVVVNTPGYLPDSDEPSISLTLEEARDSARWEVENIVDTQESDESDPLEVVGGSVEEGFVRINRQDPYSLGLVVEILECSDDCCSEFLPDEDEQPIGCDHASCDVDSLPTLSHEEG